MILVVPVKAPRALFKRAGVGMEVPMDDDIRPRHVYALLNGRCTDDHMEFVLSREGVVGAVIVEVRCRIGVIGFSCNCLYGEVRFVLKGKSFHAAFSRL